ncbi:iron uptake transporter permease EfeU [Actinacidiphila sp. DG2A-62]|jgi:high-affinity iron transporter|uniref:iron uptake transporter permease EfeU n=1 Tax=Actinacidiphila sp. DG2A-62 TaxID=3108821 RepID=UPI002DBCED8A|nr:iron uptake transporter permease EfeU [Actinacidiphila sp. DG2A-62]MEC3994075.1 iron uptake transporter permease EfeU [Actinacidiphila sp. DG2A-62]
MLPTFVIGLREGLEAALIVGIIASFLGQQGRRDALRKVWIGVGIAVAICVAVAVGLQVWSSDLPQRQQEQLETVVGAIAVVMVSYMVLWMKRHSRDLRKDLEGAAGQALAAGSASALIVMAFLAVLREGFETSVFLLATFNESSNPWYGGSGAALGIVVAAVIGYGIYRGGVRINLSRFFRVTGVVLILVAAGLVATALMTAYEGGWLDQGSQAFDLSWLVRPGTPVSSVVTGVLGIQPYPNWAMVIGWLVYAVPMTAVVLWPARRKAPAAAQRKQPRPVEAG